MKIIIKPNNNFSIIDGKSVQKKKENAYTLCTWSPVEDINRRLLYDQRE